jgi:hypothetical protein
LLDRLEFSSRRFEIESELLLKAARARARIEFVPIHSIYRNGASRIHPVTDVWRWLKWWRASAETAPGAQARPAT